MKDDAVTITGYSHDGRGLANIGGKIHFVTGALVGETVTLKTVKKHAQFDESVAEEILTPSSHRILPKCKHFGVCGGCSLQYIDSCEQIKIKQEALLDQFKRTAKIQPEHVMPPITGPNWQYRHKARLGVKYVRKKERLLIGFREVNSRFLADILHCDVLHPSIGERLEVLATFIRSLSVYEHIPQLEVAVGDEHTVIIIRHLKPFNGGDLEKIKEFAQRKNIQIYLQSKGPDTVAKFWPDDNNERLHYRLDDLTFAFHPTDFTQVNPEINRQMVVRAIEYLDLQPEESVLDLFCGLGNFSLPIAKRVSQVVGVEGCSKMVARSEENAKANQINNAQFFCADLFKSVTNAPWASKAYDKVLIDPPRSGAIEILPMLVTWKPKRIVYVSCNPATLARDCAELLKLGYHLHTAGVLDMFPQTNHVESLALFTIKD